MEATNDKIAIVGRKEIFSDSFGITRDMHYARGSNYSPRNNAGGDEMTYRTGSERTYS